MSVSGYIRETQGELKQVNWPTRAQAVRYTGLVLAVSLGTAFLLALFDVLFLKGLAVIVS